MRILVPLLAGAALTLAACASTETQNASAAPGDRDCFSARAVSGYTIIDNHNIRVRVSASRNYTMTTSWNVNDLDWTNAIALHSSTGWICTGRVIGTVELSGGEPHRSYPIETITRDPEPPADQQGS